MKKKFLLALLMMSTTVLKAQYVTIPDPNFVSWLQVNIPSAMNGNQMDTSNAAIMSWTLINVRDDSISDLTGIQYFKSIQTLDCSENQLSSLPPLPNSIKVLDCGRNFLTSLPTLPDSLFELYCFFNNLSSLPYLPESLFNIHAAYNVLTSLPTLPNSINRIDFSSNQLTSIPNFPNSLVELYCVGNQLVSLPTFPNSLIYINCSQNQLTSLPALPDSLWFLKCSYNLITTLPVLPNTLEQLYCSNNRLTSLSPLPDNIQRLVCDSNNITCFPIFPNSLDFGNHSTGSSINGNPFTCLPNFTPYMTRLQLIYPLCISGDTISNSNGCASAKGIMGYTFKDMNSNCLRDTIDVGITHVHLKQYDNNNNLIAQTYSSINGIYNFPDSAGTYTVRVDTLNMPFTFQCLYPGIDSTVTIDTSNSITQNVNFDIACKPGFDVGVQSVHRIGRAFPGLHHLVRILAGDLTNWYNLNCATGIVGQVQVTVTGPVSFDSIASGSRTPLVNGNVFTYTISDFGIVNMQNDFGLWFSTDTTAQSGDKICVYVVVTPSAGDNNPENNNYHFCYEVRNSYDPNLKEVYPVNVLPGFSDYFTYTIHFQNTGSAPAINIRLLDIQDNNLDLESFQLINYSHVNTVTISNNILTIRFPNIELPDSTSNLMGSQGFVQYRIKPKQNLPAGTQIKNTANIYFDYNFPIATNTTINLFDPTISINENNFSNALSVYPNPGNGFYYVKLSETLNLPELRIEIYNSLGGLVSNSKIQNVLTQVDLSHQPKGIYIFRIVGTKQSINQKVIKQ